MADARFSGDAKDNNGDGAFSFADLRTKLKGSSESEIAPPPSPHVSEEKKSLWDRILNASTDRRLLLKAALALGSIKLIEIPWITKALAQEIENNGIKNVGNEEIEHLLNEPLPLKVLDFLGTVCFVDAIVALAREKDSFTTTIFTKIKESLFPAPYHEEGHESAGKFPLENMYIGLILNALRASLFGEHIRDETIADFKMTVVGVSMLMGLTSLAKGIVKAESSAERMATAPEGAIQKTPEQEIAKSIFQLTVLPAFTQLPLTAFGNAKIGNGEFFEIKAAFRQIYADIPTDGREVTEREKRTLSPQVIATIQKLKKEYVDKYLALPKTKEALTVYIEEHEEELDPRMKAKIQEIIDDSRVVDHLPEGGEQGVSKKSVEMALFEGALEEASRNNTADLVNILLATTCDDTQGSFGDVGPIVGLYQSYGVDFIRACVALFPYTVAIAFDRAFFAAQRAGIPLGLVFEGKWDYFKEFIIKTWKNLFFYLLRIDERKKGKKDEEVGMKFSLIEQFATDIGDMIQTVMDAIRGSKDPDEMLRLQVHRTLGNLTSVHHTVQRLVGVAAMARPEEVVIGEKVQEVADAHLGTAVKDDVLEAVRKKAIELSDDTRLENDEARKEREKAIEEYIETLRSLEGPLLEELQRLMSEISKDPSKKNASLEAVAKMLKETPRIASLLDKHYWHERIGPELTETLFIVFLQGLHLTFVINTVNRCLYETETFRALPISVQEWISMGLNEVVSMFADNWADCIAHAKWLTKMYFHVLEKHTQAVKGLSPELSQLVEKLHFVDKPEHDVPTRFKSHQEQFAALIIEAKARAPEKKAELDAIFTQYSTEMQNYYWKSMIMAFLAAVTGGGKSKVGNSPHFTFTAKLDKDFTLLDSLKDFVNHPIYHLWEFVFGAGYATLVAPALAGVCFKDEYIERARFMMQEKFRKDFPGIDEKIRALKKGAEAKKE